MNFVQLLKEQQLKVTPQRLTIVEELYTHGHLNIDEIYRVLQNKFPSISLATIYKNIHAMIEISFLSEVKIPNKKSVYELKKEEHAHIVCSDCNSIIDIVVDTDDLLKQASQMSNCTLTKSAIVFNGICSECNKNY